MNPTTLKEFTAQALAEGFDEVLERDVPHAERYGQDGAAYWVARRN